MLIMDEDKSLYINKLKSFIFVKYKDMPVLNGREQNPKIQGISERVLVRFQ